MCGLTMNDFGVALARHLLSHRHLSANVHQLQEVQDASRTKGVRCRQLVSPMEMRNSEFDQGGLMCGSYVSINDLPIAESDASLAGRRGVGPDDQPGLGELDL